MRVLAGQQEGERVVARDPEHLPGYFLPPGSMSLNLLIRLGLAAGAVAAGLAGEAVDGAGGLAAEDATGVAATAAVLVAGCAPCALAPFFAVAEVFSAPGNGVKPFTTLAASSVGTVSLSFLIRIEILRFDGSKGLLFTRSIWSA